VVSATAAFFAVAYLAVALAGVRRAARIVLLGAAVAVVVAVPASLLAAIGSRTGVVRAQHPAVVQAAADGGRLLDVRSPYARPPETSPRGREAFSTSFRLDPPAEILPDRPLLPPGPSALVAALRPLGVRDLRVVLVAVLVGLAAALAALGRGRSRRATLAVALLASPLAMGTALGSPDALPLLAVVGAWVLSVRGSVAGSGALAGLALSLDHRAALAVPFLLAAGGRPRPRALAFAAGAYALVVVPVALVDPGAFGARLLEPRTPGPGLGLWNLLAYRGAEASAAGLSLAALAPLAAAVVVLWLLRRGGSPLVGAALASLAGISLAPALAPDAIALPLLLLALAAADEPGTPAGGQAPAL
jgi:hypothetical protein